jgi:iron complex outermembrane receptor protein
VDISYLKRGLAVLLVTVASPVIGSSQPGSLPRVAGTVTDSEGLPIAGARVTLGSDQRLTDEIGRFFVMVPAGEYVLRARKAGYVSVERGLVVGNDPVTIDIVLQTASIFSDSITVDAIRAADDVPVTKRSVTRSEIDAISYGQDVPALLENTPSLQWYSDSGTGSNYSYFSLRGIGQNRINITLDGAPLNDPAEHAVYFNNFHDFTSIVDSIQIQRGVGTSTVGAPAFGGSVNFASLDPSVEQGTSFRLGLGSFDSLRASAAYETGVLENGLALSARFSYAETDNYRERSGTRHDTIFLNATWQRERSRLKFLSFSGRERSQLAFLAVEPEILAENPRFNPLAEEERDRFGQDFAQVQYMRALTGDRVLVASLYYNGADGWFRLWDDPEDRNDLLQFGIDQYVVGSMASLSRTGDRSSTTLGVHVNDFRGDHTLEIAGSRIYSNTGFKKQANAFVKAGYTTGRWQLFGDLHLRWAEFEYSGDVDLGSVDWSFVDPKVGVRYRLGPSASLFASLGRAGREPSRLDLLAGEDNATVEHDLAAVEPEEVVDLEVGFEYRTSDVSLQLVGYGMEFENEIAATGELSEIGLPLRANVDESYRRGLELDLRWRINGHWSLSNSTSLSRSRIREWIQFYDVFDEDGAQVGRESRIHRDVEPLLTPQLIINQNVEWRGVLREREAEAGLQARWVDSSNLDNTGRQDLVAPEYSSFDLRTAIDLLRPSEVGHRLRVDVHVDNVLDERDRYPSGYSYLFITRDVGGRDSIDGIPYYYPLAGRTFAVTLEYSR